MCGATSVYIGASAGIEWELHSCRFSSSILLHVYSSDSGDKGPLSHTVLGLISCTGVNGRWGLLSYAMHITCCSVCVGGDDDLLLLATEVGVVQTSVSGGSAQVIAPRASDGSNGEEATVPELQAMGVPHVNPILFLYTHHAHF